MDTLRNYLDTMFERLPDTPDVRRAKDELYQMMDDKYTDLVAGGASQNEALGTVISEFGSLDDFADMLGIRALVPVDGSSGSDPCRESVSCEDRGAEGAEPSRKGSSVYRPILTLEETETHLRDITKISMVRAIGVACFLFSICGHTFFGELSEHTFLFPKVLELIGNVSFFGLILFGVLSVIHADNLEKRWKYIYKDKCILAPDAQYYTEDRQEQIREGLSRFRTIGIILCATCWLPAAILGDFNNYIFSDVIPSTLLFFLVGTGTGLLVMTGGIGDAHKKLLKKAGRA